MATGPGDEEKELSKEAEQTQQEELRVQGGENEDMMEVEERQ